MLSKSRFSIFNWSTNNDWWWDFLCCYLWPQVWYQDRIQALECPKHKARGTKKQFHHSSSEQVPSAIKPAMCLSRGASTICTGSVEVELERPPGHIPPSLQRAIKCVTGWHHLPQLSEVLRKGDLIACTDGSYKNGWGTAAWKLCSAITPSHCLTGNVHLPGHTDHQNSTRAELSGFCGMVAALWVIGTIEPCLTGILAVGCNSESAPHKLLDAARPRPSVPHCELAQSVQYLQQQISIKWQVHQVKGHQDNLWKMITICDSNGHNSHVSMLTAITKMSLCQTHGLA